MASSIDEHILRTTKEIVVKFIEVGRVSPTSFDESFKNIFSTVNDCVKGVQQPSSSQNGESRSS
ncbi:MAG: conjugal transfer protein TraB [Deltaproteobacteria bacterium]|nr:conjugal transfer protein TraB [Deltaproteobacteria bacterium]MBW2219200.1 conjugal transfer protein TraB [Deltaproteobacteria bacterium]